MTVDLFNITRPATDPALAGVETTAEELGRGAAAAGLPREPHKVPEISAMLRGLPNGDPIIAAVFAGYVRGYDAVAKAQVA